MSSFPSAAVVASAGRPTRPLTIDVDVPTVEIFILDSNSIIVARGIGSVYATLPTGLYKVRYRLGNTVADGVFELPAGEGAFTPPQLPALPLLTPVPMVSPNGQNLQPSAPSADLAMMWSRTTHVSAGAGSSLFVFVDAPAISPDQPGSPGIAPDAVTVNTFDGVVVASLAQGAAQRGCHGCTIAIEPGGYVLNVARGDRATVSQALYCAPGWQTEVFLPVVQDAAKNNTVDPSAASILMSPIQLGFRADSKSMLWAEAARKTLASGRANVTPVTALRNISSINADDPMIEEMLYGKFLNPMLGIYGAHLMAIPGSQDNRDVLIEVVPNLRKLLGDVPDVMALVLYLGGSDAAGLRFPNPPMLASSWSMIVRASVDTPEIVPVDSASARIAGSLWGSGAWLGWKASESQDSEAPESPMANVDWNLLLQAANPASAQLSQVIAMTPVERTLMFYVSANTNHYSLFPNSLQSVERGLNDTDTTAMNKMMAAMSPATGIPSSVLRMAALTLSRKLKGTHGVELASAKRFAQRRTSSAC